MKYSKIIMAFGVFTAVLGFAMSVWGQAAPSANPIQLEMRLLSEAMRSAVDAIAAGDVRALPGQLHAVHVAAGDTSSALERGEYTPPSGADKLEDFIALDEAFHRHLIKMVKAAKQNDVAGTAEQFGILMNRCHGCHEQFGVEQAAAD